jgi:hypothetical protein
MVINSEPYALAPATSQLKVDSKTVPGLDHVSHIDTTKLVKLTEMETENYVATKSSSHKGTISKGLSKLIKKTVTEHGIMPNDQIAILLKNFQDD